jgi:hypothetical protein
MKLIVTPDEALAAIDELLEKLVLIEDKVGQIDDILVHRHLDTVHAQIKKAGHLLSIVVLELGAFE